MVDILFVCTGNSCRSPMAEAIAKSILLPRFPEAIIASAGLMSAGRPPTDDAIKVMSDRGLDLSGHLSSNLVDMIAGGSTALILAMAREHARAVVEQKAELWPVTFMLKDLARRVHIAKPRSSVEPLAVYLHRIALDRKMSQLAGYSATDDVADPIGQGRRVYEKAADEITRLVEDVVLHLWPPTSSLR